jgi:hypothetical protein
MDFRHSNMIESSSSLVLLGDNRNRVASMGRGGYSCKWLINARARIGASVCIMNLLSKGVALLVSLQRVLGSLGPLNTLISNNRGLEVVWELNYFTLRGRKSLSNWLRSLLKLP